MSDTHILRDTIIIASEKKNLSIVREFVLKFLKKTKLQPDEISRVVLATDEAVTNIVEHAHKFNPQEKVHIELEADDETFTATLKHVSTRFDPREYPEVNIAEHIKAGRKRGLGIFIIRQIVDEMDYLYENGQNTLRIVKYIRKDRK
jgi:anti-sigma regulatory factor (Ser/Thr protein kinase)